MEERDFRRLLDLFPVVRSRDYHAESASTTASTSRSTGDEAVMWQDAWEDDDKEDSATQRFNKEDSFWTKLRLVAERKLGQMEAERFTAVFQKVHKKLVFEELSLDTARKILNSTS